MPTIFIVSGTSWIAPSDFNPNNNSIECYGGGSDGGVTTSGAGGGGAAYAKTTNVNVNAGASINIHIGSAGARDTYFNATSLANAVSNGTGISCGAQGATGTAGGLASSSCGSTKFNGGNGGTSNNATCGGGGGGGAAGPNGAGAAGGNSPNDFGGGGGGGANNGSAGTQGTSGNGSGHGGNGRLGTGGGAFNGGNATANSGGGGGPGFPTAGRGALDNVYGDSVHGPGGGGGGGTDNFASYPGGDAGGFGGGGGGGSTFSSGPTAAPGQSTDGLIVITYVSAPKNFPWQVPKPIIFRPTPIIFQPNRAGREILPPVTNLAFWRQPTDLQHPGSWLLFAPWGWPNQPFPNPTPLFRSPHAQAPDLLRHPPTLDTRQQFPGKAPQDFHATATEGADVLSTFTPLIDPANANIPETDTVIGFVIPTPLKGSADDIVQRVKVLLPKRWWSFVAPIRDAILGGIADLSSWSYSLIVYAKLQSRVAWATDIWLDIISRDYFGNTLPRKTNESDAVFRLRIQKELIRERVTRKGMITAIEDLTGLSAVIFEPWNTGDTGAWDNGTFALDIAGGWGDYLPAQSFLNVTPPGLQGIVGIGGWDTGYLAWDGGIGMWADMSLIVGSVTTQDIYDTINKTRPTGSIVWTQLFPPALPIPIPPAPTLTPITALPLPSLPVVKPNPAAYSIPVIPDSLGLL